MVLKWYQTYIEHKSDEGYFISCLFFNLHILICSLYILFFFFISFCYDLPNLCSIQNIGKKAAEIWWYLKVQNLTQVCLKYNIMILNLNLFDVFNTFFSNQLQLIRIQIFIAVSYQRSHLLTSFFFHLLRSFTEKNGINSFNWIIYSLI